MVTLKDKQNFIRAMNPVAKRIQVETGIDPLITITQSAHESRWGMSGLTQLANNLFGFTGESWKRAGKPVVMMPTREFIDGKWVSVRRPFRNYTTWFDSAKDWADTLDRLTRYKYALSEAKQGNMVNFAREIAEAGYATDPKYSQKLVSLSKEVESTIATI